MFFCFLFFFWQSFAKRQAQGFIQSWICNMRVSERLGSLVFIQKQLFQIIQQLPRQSFSSQVFIHKYFFCHRNLKCSRHKPLDPSKGFHSQVVDMQLWGTRNVKQRILLVANYHFYWRFLVRGLQTRLPVQNAHQTEIKNGSEVRNGTYANVRWVRAEPLPSIRLPVIPDHCSCEPCFKEGYTGARKVLCVAETCGARYLV